MKYNSKIFFTIITIFSLVNIYYKSQKQTKYEINNNNVVANLCHFNNHLYKRTKKKKTVLKSIKYNNSQNNQGVMAFILFTIFCISLCGLFLFILIKGRRLLSIEEKAYNGATLERLKSTSSFNIENRESEILQHRDSIVVDKNKDMFWCKNIYRYE